MLEVRTALPTELVAIGDLTADTYIAEGYVNGADGGYAATLRDAATRAEQALLLVAVVDGALVGTVTLAFGGSGFAETAAPDEAVIRMLVTSPATRGQGVGNALVLACLDAAREAGCTVVRLSTQATMTAAHRVYERLGFTRTPADDWSPEPGVDLLTYALPLSFCGFCGRGLDGGHEACGRALELDPPRYCARCRRRMVVQVHPSGWSARCIEHGTLEG